MTGILMKDLMMLKCQKQFFFVMGVVGLMFLVIYDNPTLVFGYLTIMFSFIPLTTLAYDDADNGSAYLFTLPVSRKGYLVEKYLFSARLYPGSSASDSGSGHRGLSGKKLCRTARRAGRDGYDLYYCFRNLFSSINAGAAEIWFRAKPGGGGTDIWRSVWNLLWGSMAYVQGRNQPGRTGRRTFHAGMAGSSRTWHLTVGSGIWSFFWNLVENPERQRFLIDFLV